MLWAGRKLAVAASATRAEAAAFSLQLVRLVNGTGYCQCSCRGSPTCAQCAAAEKGLCILLMLLSCCCSFFFLLFLLLSLLFVTPLQKVKECLRMLLSS